MSCSIHSSISRYLANKERLYKLAGDGPNRRERRRIEALKRKYKDSIQPLASMSIKGK